MRARQGWSLIELVVTLSVFAVASGAAAAVLVSGQRSAREAAEIRVARADLRDAASVLADELRGISVSGDTLRLATDTAVEFFAPILSGLVCATGSGPRLLLLPFGNSPVSTQPDTGDLAWVWREASLTNRGEWRVFRVASYLQSASGSCDADFASSGTPRGLTIVGDGDTVHSGAPVQLVRRGRYSVYRASDGFWYLGYRRCDALGPSRCQIVQPVAGPYRARVDGLPGIHFRYFGEDGGELSGSTAATATHRIELLIRTDTTLAAERVRRAHALDDSVVMTIVPRNPP